MKILMIVMFVLFAYGKVKRLIEWVEKLDEVTNYHIGITIGVMINIAFIGYGIFFWSWA